MFSCEEAIIIETIITDEELTLVSVINELHRVNHVLCAFHKKRNFLKLIYSHIKSDKESLKLKKAIGIFSFFFYPGDVMNALHLLKASVFMK